MCPSSNATSIGTAGYDNLYSWRIGYVALADVSARHAADGSFVRDALLGRVELTRGLDLTREPTGAGRDVNLQRRREMYTSEILRGEDL